MGIIGSRDLDSLDEDEFHSGRSPYLLKHSTHKNTVLQSDVNKSRFWQILCVLMYKCIRYLLFNHQCDFI